MPLPGRQALLRLQCGRCTRCGPDRCHTPSARPCVHTHCRNSGATSRPNRLGAEPKQPAANGSLPCWFSVSTAPKGLPPLPAPALLSLAAPPPARQQSAFLWPLRP
eukprot:3492200-Amphidinium_carterae.1